MKAVFADSMGDVLATTSTVVSLVLFSLTGINVDGIVGVGVALVVMWAGVGICLLYTSQLETNPTRVGPPEHPTSPPSASKANMAVPPRRNA